jgi:hypothetical protein
VRHWQKLGAESSCADCVGFFDYQLFSVFESGQGRCESEPKEKGEQPQDGGLDASHLSSAQLVVRLAPPETKPVSQFAGKRQHPEQRKGDQYFRLLIEEFSRQSGPLVA